MLCFHKLESERHFAIYLLLGECASVEEPRVVHDVSEGWSFEGLKCEHASEQVFELSGEVTLDLVHGPKLGVVPFANVLVVKIFKSRQLERKLACVQHEDADPQSKQVDDLSLVRDS